MSLAFGVKDVTTYACERHRRPFMIQKHVTRAIRQLSADETLYIGVTDASGGWRKEYITSYGQSELQKFLDWFTAYRHEFLMEGMGFVEEARFIILEAREFFDPKDPRHEQDASPDDKGFYRILRENEYEPMET